MLKLQLSLRRVAQRAVMRFPFLLVCLPGVLEQGMFARVCGRNPSPRERKFALGHGCVLLTYLPEGQQSKCVRFFEAVSCASVRRQLSLRFH